jgi:hypothetical protein
MDPTEIPVYGKENGAYNGRFESTCYRRLPLFGGEGDCPAAKLRPSHVLTAGDWEELLLPEIERQQELSKEVVFRAKAAFAKQLGASEFFRTRTNPSWPLLCRRKRWEYEEWENRLHWKELDP